MDTDAAEAPHRSGFVQRTFLRNDGTEYVPDGYFLSSINALLDAAGVTKLTVEWVNGDVSVYEKVQTNDGVPINYTGPDESVECAYGPCRNRVRQSAFGPPQWCSKDHRERTIDPPQSDDLRKEA